MVKRDLIRNVIIAVAIIVLLLVLRIVFIYPVKMTASQSANSYLHQGDSLLATKHQDIKIDDFVVYKVKNKVHVGRVIADQGQNVSYMDDSLYVNDKLVQENYLNKLRDKYLDSHDNSDPFTADFTLATITGKSDLKKIPTDEYLILNDNRQDKSDSRKYGLIKKSQIKGVVTFRLAPLDDFGFVATK